MTICDYVSAIFPTPVIALIASIFVGAAVTWLWANFLYSKFWLSPEFPQRDKKHDPLRAKAIAVNGMVIRSLLTTVVIWLPQATGPIVAGLLTAHALIAWGGLQPTDRQGRIRQT